GRNLQQAACESAGGQFMDIQPGRIGSNYYGNDSSFGYAGDSGAVAIMIRDGQLQTYSRKVRLLERDAAGNMLPSREFDWGLIYALANVDANFYLYPGGSGHDPDGGIIADILVKSQTLDSAQ